MLNAKKPLRNDWSLNEIDQFFDLPFNELIFQAHSIHKQNFDPTTIQISKLLSIKTGACPEDCKYCPQSGHHNTGLKKEKLIQLNTVLEKAKQAKASGATRFCMGAAWKHPSTKDFPYVLKMIEGVKALGLETCVTLGTLTAAQSSELKAVGLDYYNHNLDSSPEFYQSIITTRTYQERLDTLAHVRNTGIKVCSGGIIGMGETQKDRSGLLMQLANLPTHPESVPINLLIRFKGTPLENVADFDPFDFVRTIAVARILMPKSVVRLSAGRFNMNDQTQALSFFAGANSIFYGDTLLTAPNPEENEDFKLFNRLGLQATAMEPNPSKPTKQSTLYQEVTFFNTPNHLEKTEHG